MLVLAGLVVGLGWGVMARVWMRFISDAPEFTWSGTAFIVIAFGVFGLAQAGALAARRSRWRQPASAAARGLGGLGMLPLFAGAGAIMAPTVLLGGLAWARADWPRWTRWAAAAVAMVVPVALGNDLLTDFGWSTTAVAGWLWMLLVYAGVIIAAAATFAPRQASACRFLPRSIRVT